MDGYEISILKVYPTAFFSVNFRLFFLGEIFYNLARSEAFVADHL